MCCYERGRVIASRSNLPDCLVQGTLSPACKAAGSRSYFLAMPGLRLHGASVYIFTLFLTESRLTADEFYSCYFIRIGCRIYKLARELVRGLGHRSPVIWWCGFTGWFVSDVSIPPRYVETSGSNNQLTRRHVPEVQRGPQLHRHGSL